MLKGNILCTELLYTAHTCVIREQRNNIYILLVINMLSLFHWFGLISLIWFGLV